MSLQEQDLVAFKSNVEDLALEELQRLEATRTAVAAQLEAVTEEIRSVKAVLRALNPTSKPGRKPKPVSSPFKMSEEREAELMAFLRTFDGDTDITARTVEEHFGWSNSYCAMAVKMLRETGVLRQSAIAGSTRIYRSML